MGTTQWDHCPSRAASSGTGKNHKLKFPTGGAEPRLSPLKLAPVPAEPLSTRVALSCPGSCLHLSAGWVPSCRAARDGNWGWSCRMSSCACPSCGQPPGAIRCQTAVGAGSSLFTGAMPVMSYALWAAGMRGMRLLQVPLPLQRGWKSPPSLCCPHRAYLFPGDGTAPGGQQHQVPGLLPN